MKIFIKLKQKKISFVAEMLFWRAKHLTKFHIPTKNLCFRRNCYFFAQVVFILQRKKNKFIFSIIVFIVYLNQYIYIHSDRRNTYGLVLFKFELRNPNLSSRWTLLLRHNQTPPYTANWLLHLPPLLFTTITFAASSSYSLCFINLNRT